MKEKIYKSQRFARRYAKNLLCSTRKVKTKTKKAKKNEKSQKIRALQKSTASNRQQLSRNGQQQAPGNCDRQCGSHSNSCYLKPPVLFVATKLSACHCCAKVVWLGRAELFRLYAIIKVFTTTCIIKNGSETPASQGSNNDNKNNYKYNNKDNQRRVLVVIVTWWYKCVNIVAVCC